jgi:hypothetical protein
MKPLCSQQLSSAPHPRTRLHFAAVLRIVHHHEASPSLMHEDLQEKWLYERKVHKVYPYLLRCVTPDSPDHIWSTDIAISMDGKGRAKDNAFIEQLWRSLKYGCIHLHAIEKCHELRKLLRSASTTKTTVDLPVHWTDPASAHAYLGLSDEWRTISRPLSIAETR